MASFITRLSWLSWCLSANDCPFALVTGEKLELFMTKDEASCLIDGEKLYWYPLDYLSMLCKTLNVASDGSGTILP